MNAVDQLFLKWQGWIKNQLSREFNRLLRDKIGDNWICAIGTSDSGVQLTRCRANLGDTPSK